MSREFWSGVGVDIETALGTALVVTAISKANPGVLSYTGTDPTAGQYVLLKVAGMHQVNKRVFRIANVVGASNTFELEGEDTTDYDSFISGSAEVITFGASMTNAQDIDAEGGEPEFTDLTTIHDRVRSSAPTVVSEMTIKFGTLFDPADPAVVEMKKATFKLATRCVLLRFAGGSKMAFNAYVSAAGVPTGSAQQVVKSGITFKAQGLPTIYST
ncbi:MAG: phage tail tube protein [Rhizobacter sp.]